MQNDFKEFAYQQLFDKDAAVRKYFNHDYIQKLWNENIHKKQDHSVALRGLMMFEMWHSTFA